MKKKLHTTLLLLSLNFCLFGQNVTFDYQGYCIGSSLSGQSNFPRAMMPEIINTGTEYIMYFGYESPEENYIMYATSNDMNTWQVGDTVLVGSSDTTSREFIIGGARVIKLPNGQYRMFYRCSQKYTSSPFYHIRSAISTDGKTFTPEGICIENNTYDSNSFFKHIGHSEFYYDAGNNLRALLTAKDTTMTAMQPDNIYVALSTDGGLSWSNFVSKYTACHDPVIIVDSSQNYHVYCTYLNTSFKTGTSIDGVSWPGVLDTLFMIQNGDTIIESSSPIKIADLGAAVNPNGDIIIYSNHATEPGPWTHVAYWTTINTSSITQIDGFTNTNIYPNPFSTQTVLQIENPLHDATLTIYNYYGQRVAQMKNINGKTITLNRDNLVSGVYYVQLTDENKTISVDKLVIIDK